MSKLIEAEHLFRYYGRYCAVNDVSFTLARGQVLGFLGPNGAGKTTTMQMISGQLAPSAGMVTINGIDLLEKPTLAKSFLGYLPDTPPLYKDLTVSEFLLFCAKLHGMASSRIAQAIARAAERCGLTDVLGRLIGQLSKGFQQRLGIAQAILHNPEVVVLDEPTIGLDPIQIREIRTLIKELGQEHGVILSTHILSEVQESCSHVQIIHQGRLILHETIADLNTHMNTSCLEIITRKPIPENILLTLKGIQSIEAVGHNKYRIHHSADQDPGQQIAELLISGGFGLEELLPVKKSMEDIFIALTQDSPPTLSS